MRVPTATLALAATALATCPSKIGVGDKGWVKATVCGTGACGKSIDLPLDESFSFCNPCTDKEETEKITLRQERGYPVTYSWNPPDYKTVEIPCGKCNEVTGLSFECPVLPSCPAKTGNGKVTVKSCGPNSCGRSIKVPLGEEFYGCNVCTGELDDSKATLEVKDSTHYKVVSGDKEFEVECGKCDDGFFFSCPDEGLSGGAIAGIVIGCVVLVAAVAGGVFFVMRRKKMQNVGPTQNYNEMPRFHET